MPKAVQYVALVSIVVGAGSLTFARNTDAQDKKINLNEALKEPKKFIGQRACWAGRQVGSSMVTDADGKLEEHTIIWMTLDDKKSVVPEQTFVSSAIKAK